VLHPARNETDSAEYFVSLQGGGGRRCGGIVDRRQRGRWQNRQYCQFRFWLDGALAAVAKAKPVWLWLVARGNKFPCHSGSAYIVRMLCKSHFFIKGFFPFGGNQPD